jgi:hypothetical protein
MKNPTPSFLRHFAVGILLLSVLAHRASANVVTDWNAALGAAQKATGQTPFAVGRQSAIVHAAVFDAVNGIVRKYTPYFVSTDAPNGARADAAAVQAAYTTLLSLFPTQQPPLDLQLAASLAALPPGSAQAISDGRAWGEFVAHQIIAWRATDGVLNQFTFLGGTQPGYWRNPPDGGITGVAVQYATMVPFTMKRPTQFRPGPPYGSNDRLTALSSAAYAADVNEIKAIGSATSVTRTPEQTQLALLWASVDNTDENRAIRSVVPADASLVDTARLFALANFAAADAVIAVFDAKYAYGLWRPYHAIRLADTDNNPATVADPTWTPLAATPRHPEYLSGHVISTSSAFGVAALLLGDDQTFTLSSPGYPDKTKIYSSFSAAVNEVVEARIWIGFHFRTTDEESRDIGYEIACYVLQNFLRPRHHEGDRWNDDDRRWVAKDGKAGDAH